MMTGPENKPLVSELHHACRVNALLNSLPNWLLRTRCSLQGFLLSILNLLKDRDGPTSTSRSIWPMPIPYPEFFSAGGYLCQRSHLKRLVSTRVVVLDWLTLDFFVWVQD